MKMYKILNEILSDFAIGNLDLSISSCFGFRYSDFEFYLVISGGVPRFRNSGNVDTAVVCYLPPISRSTVRNYSSANDLQSGRFESSKVFRIGGCQRSSDSESDSSNHTIDKRSAPAAGNIK